MNRFLIFFLAVVGYIVLILILAAIFQAIENRNYLDSLFFVSLTATSTGSSTEIQPVTDSGLWFTLVVQFILISYFLLLIFMGYNLIAPCR